MQLRTEAFVKWQSKQPVAKRAGLISALDHIKRSGCALASGNCLSVGHLLMGDAIEKPDRGGVLRIDAPRQPQKGLPSTRTGRCSVACSCSESAARADWRPRSDNECRNGKPYCLEGMPRNVCPERQAFVQNCLSSEPTVRRLGRQK